MHSQVESALTTLAAKFALDILEALRGIPLEQLAHARNHMQSPPLSRRASLRTPQNTRSSSKGDPTIAQLVSLLERQPGGLRAEVLRAKLGIDRGAMQRVTADALRAKTIRKSGARRGTRYFAA